MPAHAILGASGASRWIGCAGSPNLIAQLPKRYTGRTSVYADEGSAAHTLGEQCLRDGVVVPADMRGHFIDAELKAWEVNDDMIDAVDVYVQYVRDRQRELGADLFIEVGVQPLPEFDDMFGTADAILYEPYGMLEVIDYKHGAGVFVDATDNDQMKFYALGALVKIGAANVETVRITIVQPRCEGTEPVRSWDITPAELLDFGDIMRGARLETQKPDAVLTSGDHCRWCPAAGVCPKLGEEAAVAVREDFAEVLEEHAQQGKIIEPEIAVTLPDPTNPEALYLGLAMVPALKHFCKRVEEMAQDNLEHSIPVRGRKLVRKRANRAWLDPSDLDRRLRNMKGVKVGDFTKSTLKSPAQLEKVAGIGKAFVAKHCEKPQGGFTVARAEDPRPEASLLDEFADALDETQD